METMTPRRMAHLGRLSLYVGWILGIAFATLARLIEWPDWVGAGIALGVPLAAHPVMNWIVGRLTQGEVPSARASAGTP